jgi:hypothetical protein
VVARQITGPIAALRQRAALGDNAAALGAVAPGAAAPSLRESDEVVNALAKAPETACLACGRKFHRRFADDSAALNR